MNEYINQEKYSWIRLKFNVIYFDAQNFLIWAMGAPSSLVLHPFGMSLFFDTGYYTRLILYFPCPPLESVFLQAPWFLLVDII